MRGCAEVFPINKEPRQEKQKAEHIHIQGAVELVPCSVLRAPCSVFRVPCSAFRVSPSRRCVTCGCTALD